MGKNGRRQTKTRILNDIERKALSYYPNILDAGELSFDTMAKYKALKRNDVITHDQITQNVLRRKSIRRLVLEDEISDLSDLESNLNNRGRSDTSSDNEDATTFSEASSFDSQVNKVAFWKDINTKDEDYRNAVIVKKLHSPKEKIQKSSPMQNQQTLNMKRRQ